MPLIIQVRPLVSIIRHAEENLVKCTLEPLRHRPELEFIEASGETTLDGTGMLLLEVGAPPITLADAGRRLILLDGSWKQVAELRARVTGQPIGRSLPPILSSYPRRNREGLDPVEGLASVEALYFALRLQGHDDPTLLAHYYWREEFLEKIRVAMSELR